MLSAGLAKNRSWSCVDLATSGKIPAILSRITGISTAHFEVECLLKTVFSSYVDFKKKWQANGPRQICLIWRWFDLDSRVQWFWSLVFQFDVPVAKFSHFLLPCCQTFSSCCQTFSFVVRFVHVVVVVWCLRPRGFVCTLPQILHFLHRKVLPGIFLNLTFCSLSAFFGYLLFHPSTISHQPQPMTNGAMSLRAPTTIFCLRA